MVVDQDGNEKRVYPLKLDMSEGPSNTYRLYAPETLHTSLGPEEEQEVWSALNTYRGERLPWKRGEEPEDTMTQVTGVEFRRATVRDAGGKVLGAFATTVKVDEADDRKPEEKWYAGNVAHELGVLKRKLATFDRPLEFSIPDEFPFLDKRNDNASRSIAPKEFVAEEWLQHNEGEPAPLQVVQTGRAGEFLAGFRLPGTLTDEYSPRFLEYHLARRVNEQLVRYSGEPGFHIVANSRGTDRPDYYLAMKVTAPNTEAVLDQLQNWRTQNRLKSLINGFGWNQFTADKRIEAAARTRAG